MEDRLNSLEQFSSPDGGVLLVDKPAGWTSFDVIRKLRGVLRVRKIGHAGTLDPLATGLLILASQRMTGRLAAFQALPKTYAGRAVLGAVTPSYDAAMDIIETRPWDHVTSNLLNETCSQFVGAIRQLPPMFSAVKKDGRRLYKLARKGIEVEREPRTVEIESFDILSFQPPDFDFRVRCSKGTYVRSLVHDIGQKLHCGSYLQSLRRTAIGEFSVDEAWTVQRIIHAVQHEVEVSHAGS